MANLRQGIRLRVGEPATAVKQDTKVPGRSEAIRSFQDVTVKGEAEAEGRAGRRLVVEG